MSELLPWTCPGCQKTYRIAKLPREGRKCKTCSDRENSAVELAAAVTSADQVPAEINVPTVPDSPPIPRPVPTDAEREQRIASAVEMYKSATLPSAPEREISVFAHTAGNLLVIIGLALLVGVPLAFLSVSSWIIVSLISIIVFCWLLAILQQISQRLEKLVETRRK